MLKSGNKKMKELVAIRPISCQLIEMEGDWESCSCVELLAEDLRLQEGVATKNSFSKEQSPS